MHVWMDGDRLANLLGVTALAAADRLRGAAVDGLGLAGSAPAALVHLQAWPGEPLEALRRALGISQPATVRLVDQLAASGHVERRSGPDRRTRALHLTPSGERAADALLTRRAKPLHELLGALSPAEQAALEPLLERLVAALADDRPGAVHACRLCDRRACTRDRGCPLEHTTRS
jgi:MarR family transcriptional repressor of emrRAB